MVGSSRNMPSGCVTKAGSMFPVAIECKVVATIRQKPTPGTCLRISFWDTTNSATFGVTNFVQIRGDLIPISGTITMRVFDPLGALLATVTLPDGGGTTLTYNGANVHSVEITGTSATVAFDDLQFGTVTAIDGVTVPEPSSFALFAGGALLLAGVARRRRRV